MNWKYLIIATTEIEHTKVNLQFEVHGESIEDAAKNARQALDFYIDIIEIRRL